jgi:hypothetical protein
MFTVQGEVRELDLDFLRFELRPKGQSDGARIRCHLPSGISVNLQELAGKRIEVVGVSAPGDTATPRMLTVKALRTLDGGVVAGSVLGDLWPSGSENA